MLYNWDSDVFPAWGSLGTGVLTVRVADGCNYLGTRWTWFAWEQDDGVYVRRISPSGTLGVMYFLNGARYPVVVRGTDNSGVEKVVLLYVRSFGGRSYLNYRFLYCSGGMGDGYTIRSVGDPWYIWHIEAAYNTHLDRWRIFWDENDGGSWYDHSNMRTKYIQWNGWHSNSTFVDYCVGPGDSTIGSPQEFEINSSVEEFPPEVCEDYDYPPEYEGIPNDSSRASPEGCRRFFVSFDPSIYNSSHRFLLSWYGRTLWFINENGAVVESNQEGNFNIPLTGVCNVGACSYQEIGECLYSYPDRQLSHRRFTDYYNHCNGGDDPLCDDGTFDEYPVTPLSRGLYPLSMATNDEVTVVIYKEDVEPFGDYVDDLFITVIDN